MNMNQIENFIKIVKAKQELMTKEKLRQSNEFKLLMFKIQLGINDNIKIIDGFENYAVSDKGDVYSLTSGMKLKPVLKGEPDNKYFSVDLYKNGKAITLRVNRLVALAFIYNDNPDVKILVDHKDNNRLNNNVLNLRWSTSKQNSQNKTKQKNTSSNFKGVDYRKNNKWRARIIVNNKQKHLGYFQNEIDAARKYDEYAKIYYGEYAKLNFQ